MAVGLDNVFANESAKKLDFYSDGFAARQAGNLDAARTLFQAQLHATPDHAGAANALAEIEVNAGRPAMALALARRAIVINDRPAHHWGMLGAVYASLFQFAETIKAMKEGLDRQLDHPKLWHNLGIALYQENRPADAAKAFEMSLAIAPDQHDCRTDLGMAYLAMGDLQTGLRHFEARWHKLVKQFVWDLGIPEWQGEPLEGKRIIHHHEQGFGDTIQFMRFAKDLAKRGAYVLAAVPPSLVGVAKTVPGVARAVPYDKLFPGDFPTDELRSFDYHTPMHSTVRWLGLDLAEIERRVRRWRPYVRPPGPIPTKVAASTGTKLRVGIVWAGRPGLDPDKERSAQLERFLCLTEIRGVQVYSLQKGRAGDLKKTGGDVAIIDLDGRMENWLDTADLMRRLDVVVSVDTAPLHLAGALGIPTIGLCQYARCWRWLRNRTDTPWYPTMELVTQRTRFDWTTPMTYVKERIEQMVRER